MGVKFRVADLMVFTAYCALGAWLASIGFAMVVPIGAGVLFGFEIGRRTDYSTFLMTLCGVVMGLALAMSIQCFVSSPVVRGPGAWLFWGMSAIPGAVFLGIFYWLCTRLKYRKAG